MSKIEDEFFKQLLGNGLPEAEREFKFHPKRRWRSDFAYPAYKLLIEIEGGAFSRGRHVRGYGYRNDCQKYNNAVLIGFVVLRFTSDMVRSNEAIRTVAQLLYMKGGIDGRKLDNILSILPQAHRRRRNPSVRKVRKPNGRKGDAGNT